MSSQQIILVLLGCGIILGAIGALYARKALERSQTRRRLHRAQKGEHRAERFLRSHGFEILQAQPSCSPWFFVDDARVDYGIRADFLVRRGGKKAIVEVKTGSHAPDPRSSATRRQLLEYAHCFGADDIYLFDAETGSLKHIVFPHITPTPIPRLATLIMGILAGMALGAFVWDKLGF